MDDSWGYPHDKTETSIFWFIPPIKMVMTGGWFIIVLNTLDMYIYIYLTIDDH